MSIRGSRATLGAGVAPLLALAGTGVIAAAGGLFLATGAPSGATWTPILAENATEGSDVSVLGRVSVSAVVVRLELVPRPPRSKGLAEVHAAVTNLSGAKVEQVVVSIGATPASLTIRPADAKVIRNLAAGRSADLAWTLCAISSGTFSLVATATVDGTGVDSKPISVTLPAGRC